MMRQSSSRNQRSKGGFRLKHVLQICILLAICTWLIYQVKHSHDKKRAFEESIKKSTTKFTDQKHPDLLNFGRKGLPLVKEDDLVDQSMDTTLSSKNEDSEEGQEEEEEEGEQEHDMKQEEAEDEDGKRGGDDAIDELDQDRGDEENEQLGEFSGEEEKDGQVEEDDLFGSQENEESAQEAREEHYKRDDASSAVAHDTHVTEPETGAADSRGLDEEHMVNTGIEDVDVKNMEIATNGTVSDAKSNGYSNLENVTSMNNLSNVAFSKNMTVPNADLAMNGSHSETVVLEVDLSKSENGTISNSVSTGSGSQKFLQPNSTITTLPENNTEVAAIDIKTLAKNNTEVAAIDTKALPEVVAFHIANVSDRLQNHSIQNNFVSMKEIPQDGSSISIPVPGQSTSLVSSTSGEEDTSKRHEGEDHPITSEKSENGATTQAEPAHPSHNTDTAAESEAHTNLSTFPDIQNVVKHHDLEANVIESSTH